MTNKVVYNITNSVLVKKITIKFL